MNTLGIRQFCKEAGFNAIEVISLDIRTCLIKNRKGLKDLILPGHFECEIDILGLIVHWLKSDTSCKECGYNSFSIKITESYDGYCMQHNKKIATMGSPIKRDVLVFCKVCHTKFNRSVHKKPSI